MKSRNSGADLWRDQYRLRVPDVNARRGTAQTQAWSNSRDAGELLGVTARLHPQLRGCIEALGVGDGNPRWVPDGLVVRSSESEARPFWGGLMGGPALRLRVALMGWALGQELAELDGDLPVWEAALGVEQFRKRAIRRNGPRDDQYDLPRALSFVREAAGEAAGANPNPLGVVREEMFGPHVPSMLELKYAHLPVVPLDDRYYESLGWSVRPPAVEHTGIADGLLGGGWHLVAPALVLGWMVALPLLHEPKGRATYLGRRHLGLKSGFQAADRARYFLKLSRDSRDLATLTLQRNILGALADLEVVPPSVTDVGVPVQTLLLGVHDGEECCALISGDHLRLWYREGEAWQREPQETVRLHETKEPFFMTRLFDGSIRLEGVHVGGSKEPVVLRDLTLHTFPAKAATFPAKAWRLRTGLDPRFVIPTTFLDQAGSRLPL